MEMLLKHVILVLLTVTGAAVVMPARIINLDYTEKSENVSHGSTLKFYCNLKVNKTGRCEIKLHFVPFGLNQTSEKEEKIPCSSKDQCTPICPFTVWYVNESNAGSYFCTIKMEIPTLSTLQSNVTNIIVEKGSPTVPPLTTQSQVLPGNDAKNWWLWIVIGGSSLILFILLVVCVTQRRRCRRHRGFSHRRMTRSHGPEQEE